MIDCHVHAFPDASYLAAQAPGAVADRVRRWGLADRLTGLQRAVGARLAGVAASAAEVARLRERTPPPLRGGIELLASGALASRALVAGTLDALERSMAAAGIERSVVIASPVYDNRWLLGEARRRPAIVPVARIPDVPRTAPASAWRDAFAALAEDGAAGFKIHPNFDGLPADHVAYRALFAVAEERRRFVILHTGHFTALGFRRLGPAEATAYLPLFEAHPSVRVCLAHMNREHPEAIFPLLTRLPNIYADTSWQPADAIRRALDEVGPDRLLLGSDWPLLNDGQQADAVATLREAAGATAETIARVSGRRFVDGE